tara:strand:+ start:38 stop:577 length:540 start_codon:yes stop_codon:yes gene_type:complete
MSYNVLLKGNAKFIKIYSNSTSNSFGDDAFVDVRLNQIEKDTGAAATLNSSTYEITLASNKHYVGFGFLHPFTGTYARYSQIVALDSSNNLLSEDDGFFNSLVYEDSEYYATSNALKSISDGTTHLTTSVGNRYCTENNIFKIFKSTGNSNFTFKLRGRTQGAAYTLNTDSQLVLIEMS